MPNRGGGPARRTSGRHRHAPDRVKGPLGPVKAAPSGAQLARELRGPLLSLITTADLLTENAGQLDRAQILQMAVAIQSWAIRLESSVENALTAAAVWTGSLCLQPQRVALFALVTEVLALLRPVLAQRQQGLPVTMLSPQRLVPPLGPPPAGTIPEPPAALTAEVLADSRWMAQALITLVLQASRASPPAHDVAVMVGVQRASVRIGVAHSTSDPDRAGPGTGQPGHPAVAADGDVTGEALGLDVARAIVQAHGGRLGTRRPTPGSRLLWLELPLAVQRPAASSHPFRERARAS